MRSYSEKIKLCTKQRQYRDVFAKLFVQEIFIHGTHYWTTVWRTAFGKCDSIHSIISLLLKPSKVPFPPCVPWIPFSGPITFKVFFSQSSLSHRLVLILILLGGQV